MARVALAHGLNANLVHKWRRQAERSARALAPAREADAFIPVTLSSDPAPEPDDIRIELRRGTMAVNVTWPIASSAQCAAWLRELLK